MSKSSITPNLDLVYKKWEQRGPKITGGITTQAPKQSCEVTGQLTSRILNEGRQRWRDKFGDSTVVRAVRHRKARERRRITTLPAETIATKMICQFKCSPIVNAESLIVTRPFMGQCCGCLPDSKKDFITNVTSKLKMRNILNARTELRIDSFLEQSFDQLIYSLRRRTTHHYPNVSVAVFSCSRIAEAVLHQSQMDEMEKDSKQNSTNPELILQRMQAKPSNRLLRLAGWFLLKFLSYFLHSVQVHEGQIQMVEKAVERGCPVIYIPLHRSHLDYILVTFILWNYSIRVPYIAAGDNLRIPVFSWLMKGLGGFFIRRKLDKQSGKKDLVYRAVLHSYMQELLRDGESLEFFIEGGRSRSGKACSPKGGLMSVVVDALSNDVIEDAFIVPISINYERLLDGNFNREQMGLSKVKETFSGAMKAIWKVFCSDFGSVRVEFCQPFSLKEYMKINQPPSLGSPQGSSDQSDTEGQSPSPLPLLRASSSSSLFGTDIVVEDQRHMIKRLSEHIVHTCVHSTPIMCTNLLAFLLLTKHRQGTPMKKLVSDFEWLRRQLKERGRDVAFVGSNSDVVHYSCALLGDGLLSRRSIEEDEFVAPVVSLPSVFELSYYSNTVVSVFLLESVLVCSVMYHCDITLLVSDQKDVVPASKDDILDTACEICKLLKYEFICIPEEKKKGKAGKSSVFHTTDTDGSMVGAKIPLGSLVVSLQKHLVVMPPCNKLDDIMVDILEQLVSVEVLKIQESQNEVAVGSYNNRWASSLSATVSWDDEELEGRFVQEQFVKANMDRADCVQKMVFYHHVLAPFLESYLVTARQIRQHLSSALPEEDFLRSIHKCAVKRVQDGVAAFQESAAFETIKNSLKAFEDLKLVDCYYAGNIRMVEMHDHFEVQDKLNNYVALLEMLQI